MNGALGRARKEAEMRNFDILDVKLEAIQKVGKSARTPSQCKMLADLALPLLDSLIARDRYEDAMNVAATAVAASRTIRSIRARSNAPWRAGRR